MKMSTLFSFIERKIKDILFPFLERDRKEAKSNFRKNAEHRKREKKAFGPGPQSNLNGIKDIPLNCWPTR